MEKEAVVILSGGMDSTTLLYKIVKQYGADKVDALNFDYGQKHKKEMLLAEKTCSKLGVAYHKISLGILNDVAPSALTRDDIEVPEGHYADENMKLTVVPNRNMVMLSIAAAYAMGIKAKKLYYGAHSGDHDIYPDCRVEFVQAMAKAIELADWHKLELDAPFYGIDKGDIAVLGKELEVDYSLTTTCYKGKEKACGKCSSCIERILAFNKAGINDPIEYENSWEEVLEHALKIEKDFQNENAN